MNHVSLVTRHLEPRRRHELQDVPVEYVAPQAEHVREVPLQAGGGQEDTLRDRRHTKLTSCIF